MTTIKLGEPTNAINTVCILFMHQNVIRTQNIQSILVEKVFFIRLRILSLLDYKITMDCANINANRGCLEEDKQTKGGQWTLGSSL